MTQKQLVTKTDTSNFTNTTNICASKGIVKKVKKKRIAQNRQRLQIIDVIRDLCPKYKKNSFSNKITI